MNSKFSYKPASIRQLENAGSKAVRKLREKKLRKGIPFMINCNELPSHQCYLEYSDGSINLVTLNASRTDFVVIKKLTTNEMKRLRKKFKLF